MNFKVLIYFCVLIHFFNANIFKINSAPMPYDKKVPVIKNITGGSESVRKGGTLFYEAYEPNHLNPITYRQVGSIEILKKWIFQTLLDTDVVTGDDIPRIAKSWAISENGLEFTFWLDERAKWYDGKKITAEDVKFSFEVFSMPGANSAIRRVQASSFSKIEILEPGIIKFTAKKRLFSNFEFLGSTLILPKHLYYYKDAEKLSNNEYTKLPKGSGAYYVKSWKKGDRAVLVKNKNFWGHVLPQNKGAYNFDQIIVRYVRDPQMAFEMVKKGNIDYMPIRIGNTQLWRQSKKDRAFTSGKLKALAVESKLQQGYGFIAFNTNKPIFSDKRVRVALSKAINRKEIIDKSLDGLASIPLGPLYSVDNFEGEFKPVPYDPKSALKDLAAAGWKDTDGDYILDKNGEKLSFTVIVPNARIEKEMLFIQNYWKNVGVQATVKILEYSTWKQLQDQKDFDAVSNGKGRTFHARGVDPYNEWHSDNIPSGLGNYYGYSNPKVDSLIEKGRREFDMRKRKKIFDQVNDIIANEYIMFQYSESKYSLHAINSKILLPEYEGKNWYPYLFGMKYWSKKL